MRPGSLRTRSPPRPRRPRGTRRPRTSADGEDRLEPGIDGRVLAAQRRAAPRAASASTRSLADHARPAACGRHLEQRGSTACSRPRGSGRRRSRRRTASDAVQRASVEQRPRSTGADEQDPGARRPGARPGTPSTIVAAGQARSVAALGAGMGRRATARSGEGELRVPRGQAHLRPSPSRRALRGTRPTAPASDATTRTSVAGAMGNGKRAAPSRQRAAGRPPTACRAGWTSANAGTCTQRTPSTSSSSGGVAKKPAGRSPPGRIASQRVARPLRARAGRSR